MIQNLKEFFLGQDFSSKKELEIQKISLLKRAWIMHSIKTSYMVLDATFGNPFWLKEVNPDCRALNS